MPANPSGDLPGAPAPAAERDPDSAPPASAGGALHVGDRVQLRKAHPCGGLTWSVTRTGADIGLCCGTCGRRVMLARDEFNRRLRAVLE
jgi:hypothetical protein